MRTSRENRPLTVQEFREYAEKCGSGSGYDLTLLLGPDWTEGGWDAYEKLLDTHRKTKPLTYRRNGEKGIKMLDEYLDLEYFENRTDGLHYYGWNHYWIKQEKTHFLLYAEMMDDDREPVEIKGPYEFGWLSTAIRASEDLENENKIKSRLIFAAGRCL